MYTNIGDKNNLYPAGTVGPATQSSHNSNSNIEPAECRRCSGSIKCKVEMFIILEDLSDLKFQLFSSFPISVT